MRYGLFVSFIFAQPLRFFSTNSKVSIFSFQSPARRVRLRFDLPRPFICPLLPRNPLQKQSIRKSHSFGLLCFHLPRFYTRFLYFFLICHIRSSAVPPPYFSILIVFSPVLEVHLRIMYQKDTEMILLFRMTSFKDLCLDDYLYVPYTLYKISLRFKERSYRYY